MKYILDLKWLVSLLGVAGLIFFIIAQESNIVAQLLSMGVVILAVFYFARFERTFLKNTIKDAASFTPRLQKPQFSVEARTKLLFDPERELEDKEDSPLYAISFIAIIVLAAFLFSYDLGGLDFQEDEFQVIEVAAGYAESGGFYRWSWIDREISCFEDTEECRYARAWPHSWLVAQSYKLFGISEVSSRIISVLFGILFIGITYFFTKFFTGRKIVALFAMLTFVLFPSYIDLARYTRMYVLLLPLFLALGYAMYRAITEKSGFRFQNKKIGGFMRAYFDFNYRWLIIALVLLFFAYSIHINSLVILPAVFLFLIYLALTRKEKRHIAGAMIAVIGIILVITVSPVSGIFRDVVQFVSFFARDNTVYLSYIAGSPFPSKVGLLLLSLGIASLFFLKNKDRRDKLVFLYLIVFFALFFFIYIADRYASFGYTSHVTSAAIILILYAYFLIPKIILYKPKKIQKFFIAFLALILMYTFYNGASGIYGSDNHLGNFSEAYGIIIEKYDPEREVVFGQYLREYYLQDIENLQSVGMDNYKQYEFEQFLSDINTYGAGWITWETRKSYHLQIEIISYIDRHFMHLHGTGIDDTNIEVYYFDRRMIADPIFQYNAIIEAPKEKYVTPTVFTINNDSRDVLFQHPPSKITYKISVPENSSLSFEIALNPKVWSSDKGDGVLFEILAKDGNEERKLFSKYIDPKNKVKDRKWHDELIDLSQLGGKEILLTFITTPGPSNNTDYDWAGWAKPMFISNK